VNISCFKIFSSKELTKNIYISGITNMIYAGIETVRAAAAKYMEEKLNEKQ